MCNPSAPVFERIARFANRSFTPGAMFWCCCRRAAGGARSVMDHPVAEGQTTVLRNMQLEIRSVVDGGRCALARAAGHTCLIKRSCSSWGSQGVRASVAKFRAFPARVRRVPSVGTAVRIVAKRPPQRGAVFGLRAPCKGQTQCNLSWAPRSVLDVRARSGLQRLGNVVD